MPEYKYVCLDCNYQFDEPRSYTETHGLDTPPYEHMSCCPVCGGSYDEAVECADCGDLIPECEAKQLSNGSMLCEACYEAARAAEPFYDD